MSTITIRLEDANGRVAMENLEPASLETQRAAIAEIFRPPKRS